LKIYLANVIYKISKTRYPLPIDKKTRDLLDVANWAPQNRSSCGDSRPRLSGGPGVSGRSLSP